MPSPSMSASRTPSRAVGRLFGLDACLARLRVAAPLGDADVAGSAAAAALNELPDDMPGEGAFNPALGALADEGGAFPD